MIEFLTTIKIAVAKWAVAGLVGLLTIAGYTVPNSLQPLQLGSTLPIAGQTYSIAGSGISGSATSITLTSLTLPQTGYKILDADLSTTFYITLESGKAHQEIVSCTTVTQNANNSATLSGCSRGLLPISPYTASSTYQFPHAGGTSVVFSNPPQFYNQFLAADNTGTITGQYTFSTSPIVPTVISASTTNAASIGYVNAVALAGSADAATTVKGVAKLSTAAASSTNPVVVGDNDTRVSPVSLATVTAGQVAAMLGSFGTPVASTNRYLTELDATSTVASSSRLVRYTTTGQITATTTPVATTDATSKSYVDSLATWEFISSTSTFTNVAVPATTRFILVKGDTNASYASTYGEFILTKDKNTAIISIPLQLLSAVTYWNMSGTWSTSTATTTIGGVVNATLYFYK